MMADLTKEIQSTRVHGDRRTLEVETVAAERDLVLFIDGQFVNSFTCSPELEAEMIKGYLLSTGRVSSVADMESLKIERSGEVRVQLQALQPRKKSKQKLTIEKNFLTHARESLVDGQVMFQSTRAFHGALITEVDSESTFLCEDISRYCAVDKVIGHCANEGFNLQRSLLLTTGRLMSSVVSKAVTCGIPLLASMTVATKEGIRIAEENDLTLLGGLTELGFWLYNEGTAKIS